MRISDWSSDVCSSDLWWAVQGAADGLSRQRLNEVLAVSRFHLPHVSVAMMRNIAPRLSNLTPSGEKRGRPRAAPEWERMPERRRHCAPARYFCKHKNGIDQIQLANSGFFTRAPAQCAATVRIRSEEHTSERRVGNEWVSTGRSRLRPEHYKNKQSHNHTIN